MSRIYYRPCRDCGDRIRMAQMNNGHWLAFDDGGKHFCGNVTSARTTALQKPRQNISSNQRSRETTWPNDFEAENAWPSIWPALFWLALLIMIIKAMIG